ncbi:MAG: ATP-binding cassette domain-containing protein [Actinomycetota bacterium]
MAYTIEAEGLRKAYGQLPVLTGLDLRVEPGSVFALLGPNGAGKTTTVRILSTIIAPDGGSAEVLGYDVVRDAAAIRYGIGLAGQNAAVDPSLTGRENLRLIGRLTHLPKSKVAPRAGELLEQFGLSGAGDRTVRTYSGGMRRRLDLAAALVHRPPVLFLDEPTTGLDPHGRRELWDMLRELVADGTTVLLTTQYLEEADRLADRVAVIDGGQVIALDTPAALKSKLGATVIEMGWPTDDEAQQAETLAAQLLGRRLEREGSMVRIASDDGPHVLVEVLPALEAKRLAPKTLAVREPSLDDVFLALTGRHAEGTQPDGPAVSAVRGGNR